MNYFNDPNNKHFSFESFVQVLEEDSFGVVSFKGYEIDTTGVRVNAGPVTVNNGFVLNTGQ